MMRYSEEDLQAARELRKSGVNPRHVCFLGQQAVEKAIKALLIAYQIESPKSHDLEALVGILPGGAMIRSRAADLVTLSEWAVEARYPGGWPEATDEDAKTAMKLAGEALAIILDDFTVALAESEDQ